MIHETDTLIEHKQTYTHYNIIHTYYYSVIIMCVHVYSAALLMLLLNSSSSSYEISIGRLKFSEGCGCVQRTAGELFMRSCSAIRRRSLRAVWID